MVKGILFKPDMVQAIIEGRKTQTRRVIKPQLEDYRDGYPDGYDCPPASMVKYKGKWIDDGDFINDYAPYQVGEVVYVKEAWQIRNCGKSVSLSKEVWPEGWPVNRIKYDNLYDFSKRSPLFMSEWAARYFIKLTGVRAERLQEITEEDAEAEGLKLLQGGILIEFRLLWDSINPKYPWEMNPWVWVYSFEKV